MIFESLVKMILNCVLFEHLYLNLIEFGFFKFTCQMSSLNFRQFFNQEYSHLLHAKIKQFETKRK
jgi:hypothetical protein